MFLHSVAQQSSCTSVYTALSDNTSTSLNVGRHELVGLVVFDCAMSCCMLIYVSETLDSPTGQSHPVGK